MKKDIQIKVPTTWLDHDLTVSLSNDPDREDQQTFSYTNGEKVFYIRFYLKDLKALAKEIMEL